MSEITTMVDDKVGTTNLEKALVGFYVEYRKLVKAGANDKYDELSTLTDSMDILADEIIKRKIN